MISKFTVEAVFEVVRDRCTKDEIVFICPEPGCGDSSGNRSVNLKTGKTSCWRCGRGGDIFRWAKFLGYDIEEELPAMTLDDADKVLDDIHFEEKKVPVYVAEVSLPKGFTPIADEPDSYYARRIERMANRKNLGWEDFVQAGVGFTRESRVWEPYAIFPVTEWGRVCYYQGRTYNDPEEGSTKKFPSKETCPYGSRHWVYGLDKLRAQKADCIVVESILNVKSLERELAHRGMDGVVPVAIFKHKMSAEQAKKLSALRHLGEVCLMFDEDATAAAWEAAVQSAKLPLERFTIVEMPKDARGKGIDANDNAKLAVDLYLKRTKAAGREGMLSQLDHLLDNL